MEKNLDFLKENLIAHRGMHNIEKGIPENSIISFQKAIDNLYTIELDIHILKDGSVVVFHDDNLKRMTGIDMEIKNITYEQVKDLKLQNTIYKIPLLQEVLDLVNGKVPIIIELKYDVKYGVLEEKTFEILKGYKGKYAVKSFNPFTVYWIKKNYPNVIRGQLSYDYKGRNINPIKKWILKNMLLNCITNPDFISYQIDSMPNYIIKKYRNKKIILGWTVKNKKQMDRAKEYCDNFICENLEDRRKL